jgi:hypothetical protein
MTSSQCTRCQRWWAHTCGPSQRFLFIAQWCPSCVTHPELGERVL